MGDDGLLLEPSLSQEIGTCLKEVPMILNIISRAAYTRAALSEFPLAGELIVFESIHNSKVTSHVKLEVHSRADENKRIHHLRPLNITIATKQQIRTRQHSTNASEVALPLEEILQKQAMEKRNKNKRRETKKEKFQDTPLYIFSSWGKRVWEPVTPRPVMASQTAIRGRGLVYERPPFHLVYCREFTSGVTQVFSLSFLAILSPPHTNCNMMNERTLFQYLAGEKCNLVTHNQDQMLALRPVKALQDQNVGTRGAYVPPCAAVSVDVEGLVAAHMPHIASLLHQSAPRWFQELKEALSVSCDQRDIMLDKDLPSPQTTVRCRSLDVKKAAIKENTEAFKKLTGIPILIFKQIARGKSLWH
ncbi:uncharacterized protein CIMG_12155 [Coccidioides immitis RS]|uniref:Uncharacterized protein n=1 Tax=Coccidioides immitis (strain RS) TaxID=246410 RepID=A0A0D8JWX6_COCIM|nr:uncharacterized protein CIMG_12155 [Coccidioides immitis RS]KJF60783.1 hypothetical protein CIMG_12155 [Coccidioides immitis RS]